MRFGMPSIAGTWLFATVLGGCGQEPGESARNVASTSQKLDSSALSAEYYKTRDFTGEVVRTLDDNIDINWMNGGPPLPGFPVDNFSVRWTGKVTPFASGVHRFYVHAYDGARVWLNNQLIIDDWAWDEDEQASDPITLTGGQAYDLKMDYFEGSGSARAHLKWTGPGIALIDGKIPAVPPEALSAPGSSCATPDPLPVPDRTSEIYRNDFENEDPSCWATTPTRSRADCNGEDVYQITHHGSSGVVGIATNEQRRSGQKALRVTFSAEEDEGGARVNPNSSHVFYRHYDYYPDPNFDFAAGMKIARFGGHASGSNQFDIILVSGARKTAAGDFCQTNDMSQMFLQRNGGSTFGNLFPSVSFPRGRWISIETEIKLNTPGLADGEARVYVDGERKIEATGLNSMRDADDTLPINTLLIGGWFSNRTSNPQSCWPPSPVARRYIDDVVISSRYIGPEPTVTRGADCTEQVVTFTTPVAGSTQVEYGPTSSYGSQTALDSSAKTNHSQTLNGLSPGKGYHYRVKSTWGNGYQYVSPDYTFVAK